MGNDMHLQVPAVEVEKLIDDRNYKKGQTSKEIREKVINARKIQQNRFKKKGIYMNAHMKNKHVKELKIEPSALLILKQAVNAYNLSARTYFRLIKVSQTIADLESATSILDKHVAEALQYRIRVEG